MANETNDTTQEVMKPATVQGVVRFGTDQMGNPAPLLWKRVSDGIKYLSVSFIGLVSASTIFNSHQESVITFCLSALIIFLGGLDLMLGVAPQKTN